MHYLPGHWLHVLLQCSFIQIWFLLHSPPCPQLLHATGYKSWQSKMNRVHVSPVIRLQQEIFLNNLDREERYLISFNFSSAGFCLDTTFYMLRF